MLLAVDAGMGHSDSMLRDDPLMAKMSDADRRLATTLVLGVLRWQIQLDEQIRKYLSKPNLKFDPAVLVALRMGAFQLLHLDRVPAHAAIDESVELTKRSRYRSAAGLVNAVLHKIASAAKRPDLAAEGATEQASGDDAGKPPSAAENENANLQSEGATDQVLGHEPSRAETSQRNAGALAPGQDPSLALAAHPAWMIDRWTQFFGEGAARAICIHDQNPPSNAIRLSAPEDEQELVSAGITLSPGTFLTSARIVESGDIIATAAFSEGRVRIQDEGSQLVAEIAALPADSEPRKILDCCAAPGGKSMILAERNPAARIVACEASRPRVKQLRARLSRFGERVECRMADATALTFDSEFDSVLADVPCSGTGTLSRNPEIRHRLQLDDLPRHAERQRAILHSAVRALRPGGRAVYSTCSLEREENEDVVRAVLAQASKLRVAPIGPALEALRGRGMLSQTGEQRLQSCLTPEGFLRLIPGELGTDGFFIAVLEKLP